MSFLPQKEPLAKVCMVKKRGMRGKAVHCLGEEEDDVFCFDIIASGKDNRDTVYANITTQMGDVIRFKVDTLHVCTDEEKNATSAEQGSSHQLHWATAEDHGVHQPHLHLQGEHLQRTFPHCQHSLPFPTSPQASSLPPATTDQTSAVCGSRITHDE